MKVFIIILFIFLFSSFSSAQNEELDKPNSEGERIICAYLGQVCNEEKPNCCKPFNCYLGRCHNCQVIGQRCHSGHRCCENLICVEEKCYLRID
ncbi:hypothetical protein ABPG74_004696 [Tetrahymena malaccensis]